MNDNEIIKALECCSNRIGRNNCPICPNFKNFIECEKTLAKGSLDLINRQNAEIEILKEKNREFVERLEKKICKIDYFNPMLDRFVDVEVILKNDFDNLVKEKAGDV